MRSRRFRVRSSFGVRVLLSMPSLTAGLRDAQSPVINRPTSRSDGAPWYYLAHERAIRVRLDGVSRPARTSFGKDGVDRGLEYSKGLARRAARLARTGRGSGAHPDLGASCSSWRDHRIDSGSPRVPRAAHTSASPRRSETISRQRGFTVDVVETAGSVDNVAMLQSGRSTSASCNRARIRSWTWRGLTAISRAVLRAGLGLLQRRSRYAGMDRPQDLVGKRVRHRARTAAARTCWRTSSWQAIDVGDGSTTIVAATTDDMLAMLQAGTLDAAFVVASPAAPIITQYATSHRYPDLRRRIHRCPRASPSVLHVAGAAPGRVRGRRRHPADRGEHDGRACDADGQGWAAGGPGTSAGRQRSGRC